MDFSFILPGIKEKPEYRMQNNINILKNRLITLGYSPSDVDFMIRSSSQGKKLSKLDLQQLQEIESTLEAQLFMAKQCLELVKETK